MLAADARRAYSGIEAIERNGYGKGDREESLRITADGRTTQDRLEISVGERQYTAEEMKEIFDRAAEELELLIKGENESLDQVSTDLNLVTSLPDLPVTVEWALDRYDVMNVMGEIRQEELDRQLLKNPGGILVNLEAVLTYSQDQTKQALHPIGIRLCRQKQSGDTGLLSSIREEIEENDNENRTKEIITLPKEVNGKEIRYYYPMEPRGAVLAVIGVITAVLLVGLEKQNVQKAKEKRQQTMLLDYPRIVSQLNLLLGAGMSTKSAWKRIVDDYQQRKGQRKERAAYEEMVYTWHEMCGGISERECYENFGNRCGLQAYMKLGALLAQNLRKGTRGLTDALRLEGMHAFEERKALAKKRGEEAGTKLLLPMFLMLAVVLVIVIVPAFLSISL